MGPLHGVQSFRNRLLQRGTPTRSHVLPENLPRRGLLSPRVRRSWQKPAPAQAPHGVTASFRHPPALAWESLSRATGGDLLLHGLQGNSLPHHGFSSQVTREDSLLRHLEHVLPSPSSLTLEVCRVVSFTLSHSFLSTAVSLQFIFSSPSSICYSRGATILSDWLGLGQQWVHLRAGWHWVYQTWGKVLTAAHRSHPCNPPATKTLPRKPITVAYFLYFIVK